MWFKQLFFFQLSPEFVIDSDKLRERLAARPFTPPGGLDWFGEGWVPPAAHIDGSLYEARGYRLVTLRREDKVLPAGVIRDFLDKKIAEVEAAELRKVGRKEKLALKEQITDDLLPRAFTRAHRVMAYIDDTRSWLMVDSSTASKAENLVSTLREALPPFPCKLPRTALSPHSLMTDWLAAGEAGEGFDLDSQAVLEDCSENGAVVKVIRTDLTSEEIRQHIQAGKQVTELGLIWRERIRFVLTSQLQLKRLQFLDVLQEEATQAGDDLASLFDATFLLQAEELGELVNDLVAALGGLDKGQPDLFDPPAETAAANDATPWGVGETPDPLYEQAVEVVTSTRKASVSNIQRHLRIGYNRAADLVEAMETAGIVSPMDRSGARKVLKAA